MGALGVLGTDIKDLVRDVNFYLHVYAFKIYLPMFCSALELGVLLELYKNE